MQPMLLLTKRAMRETRAKHTGSLGDKGASKNRNNHSPITQIDAAAIRRGYYKRPRRRNQILKSDAVASVVERRHPRQKFTSDGEIKRRHKKNKSKSTRWQHSQARCLESAASLLSAAQTANHNMADQMIPADKIKSEPSDDPPPSTRPSTNSPRTPTLPVSPFSAASMLSKVTVATPRPPSLGNVLLSGAPPIIIRPQGSNSSTSSPILLVPVSSTSGAFKSPGQSLLKHSALNISPKTLLQTTSKPASTKLATSLLPVVMRSDTTTKKTASKSPAAMATRTTAATASKSPAAMATRTTAATATRTPAATATRTPAVAKTISSSSTSTVASAPKSSEDFDPDSDNVGVRIQLPGNTHSMVCGLVFNWRTLGPDGNPVTFKDFLCNFCQEKYRDEDQLKSHVAQHTFSCNHCNYKSFSRLALICHKQRAHPDHLEEILGFEGFENAKSMKPVSSDSVASADSTMTTPVGEIKASSSTPDTSVPAGVSTAQSQASPTPLTKSASSTTTVITTTTNSTKSPTPPTPHTSNKGNVSSSYFTYKIVHNQAGSAVAYECDVCSFQTYVLKKIYEHAGTHTLDDLQKSSGGNIVWECFYCQFKASLQVIVVDHVTAEHPGKQVQLKRYQSSAQSPVATSQSLNLPLTVRSLLNAKKSDKKDTPSSSSAAEAAAAPAVAGGKKYMWGCYYCDFLTPDRERVVAHEKQKHTSQKLVITRREVGNAAKAVASASPASENSSRRKQVFPKKLSDASEASPTFVPIDSALVTRGNHPSKYDRLVTQLSQQQPPKSLAEMTNPDDASSIDKTVAMLMDNYAEDFSGPSSLQDEAERGEGSGPQPIIEYLPVPQKEVDYSQLYVYTPAKGIGKCNLCGKEFAGKHALGHVKEHVTSHTGEKAWGCAYCEFKSNRRVSTYKHVLHRHKESPLKLIRRKPYRSSGRCTDMKLSPPTPDPTKPLSDTPAEAMKKSKLRGPRSVREERLLSNAKTLWQCPLCLRRSVFKGTIVVHMKLVHPGSDGKTEIQRWARPTGPGKDVRTKYKQAKILLYRLEEMRTIDQFQGHFDAEQDPLLHDRDLDEEEDNTEEFSSMLKYKCRLCNFRAYRIQKVKAHVLAYHPGSQTVIDDLRSKSKFDRLYFCPQSECAFVTALSEALDTHVHKYPSHRSEDYKLAEDQTELDSMERKGSVKSRLSSLRSAYIKTESDESSKETAVESLSTASVESLSTAADLQIDTMKTQGVKRKARPKGPASKRRAAGVSPGERRAAGVSPVEGSELAEAEFVLKEGQEKVDRGGKLPSSVTSSPRTSSPSPLDLLLCKYCNDMVTTDTDTMRQHLCLVHAAEPPVVVKANDKRDMRWMCVHCHFMAVTRNLLNEHLTTHHSQPDPAAQDMPPPSPSPTPLINNSAADDDPDYVPRSPKKRSSGRKTQQEKTLKRVESEATVSRDDSSSRGADEAASRDKVTPPCDGAPEAANVEGNASQADSYNFDETPDGRYSLDGVPLVKPRPYEKSIKFPKRFLCDECNQCFDLLEQIRQHQLTEGHCRLVAGGYCCSDRRAKAMRKKKRIFFCEFPLCLYYCKTIQELANHMQACGVSGESWERGQGEDTEGTEAADKMYQCSHCTCIMTRIEQMKQHLLREHDTSEGGYTEMHSSFTADGNLHISVKDNKLDKHSSSSEEPEETRSAAHAESQHSDTAVEDQSVPMVTSSAGPDEEDNNTIQTMEEEEAKGTDAADAVSMTSEDMDAIDSSVGRRGGDETEVDGNISRSEVGGDTSRSEVGGGISRSEGGGDISRSEGGGDIFRSEVGGDISRSEGGSDISRSEVGGDISRSKGDRDMPRSGGDVDMLPSEGAVDILPSEGGGDISPSDGVGDISPPVLLPVDVIHDVPPPLPTAIDAAADQAAAADTDDDGEAPTLVTEHASSKSDSSESSDSDSSSSDDSDSESSSTESSSSEDESSTDGADSSDNDEEDAEAPPVLTKELP